MVVANSSFEQQYARAYALIESTLSGEMPINIAVVDAIRDGAMRGAPVEHEPDQRQVYIYQLDRDERDRFLHGYEKIHQDVKRYLTMIQPDHASAPHR